MVYILISKTSGKLHPNREFYTLYNEALQNCPIGYTLVALSLHNNEKEPLFKDNPFEEPYYDPFASQEIY